MKLILLFTLLLMLTGMACSGGLTEQEVRQIVEEHSAPSPKGDQGETGHGASKVIRVNRETLARKDPRVSRER